MLFPLFCAGIGVGYWAGRTRFFHRRGDSYLTIRVLFCAVGDAVQTSSSEFVSWPRSGMRGLVAALSGANRLLCIGIATLVLIFCGVASRILGRIEAQVWQSQCGFLWVVPIVDACWLGHRRRLGL